ncbi:lipopolysaccharide assembly protein LapB [Chitinophaga sp. SYP-B3965]|uniref:tetratricopeptide repeat protein n=1 Tax=Chitinophaga sp. SYP-B3965 TaxID=2663120 RepID=UPI0015677CB8|nr:tetratricopeptide repeat protein [Chitinophaga sp. SYP-B3965]
MIRTIIFMLLFAVPAMAQDNIDKALLMDYFQEQQFDKAIQYLEGVKPQQANGLALLASAYYQSGQMMPAEKYYTLVLAQDSNHIQAHQALGNIARQQKQPLLAIAHFEKLVALRPTNPLYYKQLSIACGNVVGLQDSAFNYMWMAYQLNPKDVSVVTALSADLIDEKEYARADSLLKQYMLIDSSQVMVISQLVKTSYLQKDFSSATLYGERLMAMNALELTAFSYLSVSYYALKKYDSCIIVYDKTAAMTRGNAPETIIYYAGISYARMKQFDKSNELIQRCIDLAKSKSLDSYYATLADNYEQMKQFRRAISYYDTSYYLFKDPMRQYGIGRIYEQHLQDPLNAKKHYRQYVKDAKPENKEEESIHTYVKERIKNL